MTSNEENMQNALDFMSYYPNVDGRSCSMKKSKVPKFHGCYKQNSTQKLSVSDITSDPQDISQAQNLRYV
jgi:hypothetical protein